MQTTVGRHDQNIQNRSSTRAPQFSTSQSGWSHPNSPSNDVSCCLPAKISRVPHLRIQSCSLEKNLAVVRTCLNLDSTLTDFSHLAFTLIFSSACTNNQMLCVHTFQSFDILHRIVGVLLSFIRNLCLSGFVFLSYHPFLPLPDFSLPSPFRETASTSIESSRCVFPAEVVLEMRLLLK